MTEGVRHLAHEPVLKHVLVAIGMTLFVLGFVEATIYALLDFYDKPPTYAGVLVTVQGVGAIAGGLTTTRWVRRLGEPGTLALGLVVLSAAVAVIALASALWVVLAGMLVCGYGIPLLFISFSTLLQRRTPQRLMGRASAAVETLMGVPQAISLAIGAGLVVVLDFRVIFGIVAGVTLLGAGYLAATLRSALWRPVVVPVDVSSAGNVEAADPMRPPS
jgi:MFS family permease